MRQSHLFPNWQPTSLPDLKAPLVAVIVDTEEEFDWSRPFSRAATSVTAMRGQERAQRLLARYGLVPTYAITYPVATQADGYQPLLDFRADGACEIGAHLHPWVTPPFDEAVNDVNSIAGNLPPELERAKLQTLSGAIAERFGQRPTLYKAGRYGLGPASAASLEALGFGIDASVLPAMDLRPSHGPDYRSFDARPFWFGGSRPVFELPVTSGLAGPLRLQRLPARPALRTFLARGRLAERITLSPEGYDHAAHRRLSRALLARGQRVLTITYHSPSLVPGHTPYVRGAADLAAFLDTLERTLDFLMGQLGGQAATPGTIMALSAPPGPRSPPGASAPGSPDP